jgi:S-adenosylmethionine decarboxylase
VASSARLELRRGWGGGDFGSGEVTAQVAMPVRPETAGGGRRSRRYHVIVDIYDCPCRELSTAQVHDLLVRLPRVIGMRVLAGPVVAEGVPDNPGLSGFAIIDYSHISIHTFHEHDEIMVDVFSCRPYERRDVVRFLSEVIGTDESHMDVRTVSWG